MEWILKEAISGRESIILTPQNRPVRQNEPLEQFEVVLAHVIADVDGPTADGT